MPDNPDTAMVGPDSPAPRRRVPRAKPPKVVAHYHALKATEKWAQLAQEIESHARRTVADREATREKQRDRSARIDLRDETEGQP